MPENLAVLVAAFWASILVGISFIAIPMKFQAASLTRPVALDIGRVTFHFFSRIEWLFAALLFGTEVVTKGAAWRWPLAALVATIVLLQSVWLLPALERRVAWFVSGRTLAPSPAHWAYGALEGLKLLALLALIDTTFAH